MKREKREPNKAIVVVRKFDPMKEGSDADWYTPTVLRSYPLRINASAGAARCEIEEDGWERTSFSLTIDVEPRKIPGTPYQSFFHSTTKNGVRGTFTRDDINNIIVALTAARDKAETIGLLTERPVPRNPQELLAAEDIRKKHHTLEAAR
ncbi:MAG: hypothetical protein ACRENK_17000 [Gemmatimonadaceae bacterium]